MQTNFHVIALSTLVALSATTSFAQKPSQQVPSVPAKVQKYNGYGLPNTKFKKIKVDLTKKKKPAPIDEQNLLNANTQLTEKSNEDILKDIQKSTNQVTAKAEAPKKETSSLSFNLAFSPTYYIQAQQQKDGSRSEYLSHELAPGIKYGDYSLTGFFYYYDDIKNPSSTEWQDSTIVLSRKPIALGSYINFTPSANGGLPLSKASREVTEQKYTLGVVAALGMNSTNTAVPNLILSYSLGYTKMMNQFETNTKNEPVSDYRFRQRFNLGYKFTDALVFRSRFQLDTSYSTQNVARNAYYHYQLLEYTFTEKIQASFGHGNGGSVYTIGESETDYYLENTIKFYGPESSEFFLGLTLSI